MDSSNVIVVAFGRKATDGGKARIRRRRDRIRDLNEPITPDDLVMDHADPEADTRPSELA